MENQDLCSQLIGDSIPEIEEIEDERLQDGFRLASDEGEGEERIAMSIVRIKKDGSFGTVE